MQDIENIQNKFLKIILGDIYSSYAVTKLLSDRDHTHCANFVNRVVKSGLHLVSLISKYKKQQIFVEEIQV